MANVIPSKCPLSQATLNVILSSQEDEPVEQDQPQGQYSEYELSYALGTGTLTHDQALFLHVSSVNWQCHVRGETR